jgi:hypothetical protein
MEMFECALPSGRVVQMRRLFVRFGEASPNRLRSGALQPSYTSKPLVTFNGAAMFGELALLRWLEVDGWEGVWLDTAHGRRCWRDMPTRSDPVALPPAAQRKYDEIVAKNGGRASGTFDVMAWRGDQTIFVEYSGQHDQPNKSERAWIDAALWTGVSPNDLFVVVAAPEEHWTEGA